MVLASMTHMLIHIHSLWLSSFLCSMSTWVRIHLFVLTSLDHPSSVDWTEILNSGGEGFNHRNDLELNIGHCNSMKLFKQGALGDFSLATFFCGFQSPTMFLPLDSSHNSLILFFPASLSWSKILLMFSDSHLCWTLL